MKLISALFLTLCLQVAMNPFCLCLGPEGASESSVPTCCRAPANEDPAPCPHCEQEMPLAATVPANSHFSAVLPEFHGFELPLEADLVELLQGSASEPSDARGAMRFHDPPPQHPGLFKQYGAFLV